jgi:23S rRNA pseudouridine1911/1915/1917 synthase
VSHTRHIIADRGDARRRLDLVLRRHLTDVEAATRTRVQGWIEDGCVTVNGTTVRRVSTRAGLGDVVAVAIPERDVTSRPAMTAENVALSVLYEDDFLLALDKPAGMVVHPAYRNVTGTMMNALLWRARTWPAPQRPFGSQVGHALAQGRPSIVGRLDKDTSGVVLVAKSAAIHAALQREMSTTSAEKEYLAVVYGRVNVARGTIDLRLAKDASDRRRVVASPDVGASSVTRFERLSRVAAPRAGLSLLRCRLVTGRTHQIRVHLAARGWPIVGDRTYGEPRWELIVDPVLASAVREFPRQALHAWRVAFTHPITRRRLTVEAPLPYDFKSLIAVAGLAGPV